MSCALFAPAPSRAALGAAPEVAAYGAVKAFAARRAADGSYTISETRLNSGTVVREYVARDGKVFAITWSGSVQPDFRLYLGVYHRRYLQAAQQLPTPRARHLVVDAPDLVIESNGRMRSFSGLAALPRQLPAGVTLSQLQ